MSAGRSGRRVAARGFALIIVLATVAVMALVVGAFAARIDGLRAKSANFSAYAKARVQAGNAAAAGFYWITTRPGGPGGFGELPLLPGLWADGRHYDVNGAELRVQDLRGLFALNDIEREPMTRLLLALGAPAQAVDGLIDVLLDYTDTDRLKRLNGAEAADYALVGLPPPRDDWLLSTRELQRMPQWRDNLPLIDAMDHLAGISRAATLNPNTVQRNVLRAYLPQATSAQLDMLDAFRRERPLLSSEEATRLTGLSMPDGRFVFHTGEQFRLTVWASGLPMALQYNLLLLPGGTDAPWLVSEVHTIAPSQARHVNERVSPFPLVIGPARP